MIVLASASAAKLPIVTIANHPELDGKQQVAGKNVLITVDINKQPYSVIPSPSLIVSYKSSKETCPPQSQIIESVEVQTCPINIFSTTDTTTVHIVPVQKSQPVLSQQSSSAESPTGAVVFEEGNNDRTGIAVTVILILCITSMILITKGAASNKTRIVFVVVVMFIIAFTAMKIPKSGPTGYTVQEYEEPAISGPEAVVEASGCVIVNIPGQQPETICSQVTECSDGIDTTEGDLDFEDSLIDCADPGCHDDGNANNLDSCDPDDDFEQDMDEYDHPPAPVVDNQIDVYDIVKWIQYFDIYTAGNCDVNPCDYSSIPLVDCDDALCTGSGANCVGDESPDGDLDLDTDDMIFLQQEQLDNANSITDGICFTPS